MYNAENEQMKLAVELIHAEFSIKSLLKVVQLLRYAA